MQLVLQILVARISLDPRKHNELLPPLLHLLDLINHCLINLNFVRRLPVLRISQPHANLLLQLLIYRQHLHDLAGLQDIPLLKLPFLDSLGAHILALIMVDQGLNLLPQFLRLLLKPLLLLFGNHSGLFFTIAFHAIGF